MDDVNPPESNGEADKREQSDARERALDARESHVREREARQAERSDEVDNVLQQAGARDEEAAARDWAAAQRDMAANMNAWINDDENRDDAETRQTALDDRLASEGDRHSAAMDRSFLAKDSDPQQSEDQTE